MTKETTQKILQTKTSLEEEINQSIESMRSLFVAIVSFVITIAGWRPQSSDSKSTSLNVIKKSKKQSKPQSIQNKIVLSKDATSQNDSTQATLGEGNPSNCKQLVGNHSNTSLPENYESNSTQNNQERNLSIPGDVSRQATFDAKKKSAARTIIRDIVYTMMAGVSTVSLVVGVSRLSPIAERLEPIGRWANSQNECIEKAPDGTLNNKVDLPMKVMNCNGGHE